MNENDKFAPGAFDGNDGKVVPLKDQPGGEVIGEAKMSVDENGVTANIVFNEKGLELRRQALLAEEQADEDALKLLQDELGAEVIEEHEHDWGPERVVVHVKNKQNAKLQICLTCGDYLQTEYEEREEKYLVAAMRIDEMAFDGQWYPTSFTEEAIQEAPLELLEREIFFLIHVTTEV